MTKLTQILAKSFPLQCAAITDKDGFYHATIPLLPTMYRDANNALVLTGCQHITIVTVQDGNSYGLFETVTRTRPYRSKAFRESTASKCVVTGATALDVANKLVDLNT